MRLLLLVTVLAAGQAPDDAFSSNWHGFLVLTARWNKST